MTHEDAGKYSAKHPTGTDYDPAIAAALTESADEGRIGCAVGHDIAAEFAVSPAEIGKTADLLELRIYHCQMGLFGYSPEKRIVKPAPEVADDLRAQLTGSALDGRIDCAGCWDIAEKLSLSKLAVAAACEHLGLKVQHCQLGAF